MDIITACREAAAYHGAAEIAGYHNRGHGQSRRPFTFSPCSANVRPRTEGDPMLTLRSILRPARVVYAHCDIPCGIYDPEQARIEAESCYKIIGMYGNVDY